MRNENPCSVMSSVLRLDFCIFVFMKSKLGVSLAILFTVFMFGCSMGSKKEAVEAKEMYESADLIGSTWSHTIDKDCVSYYRFGPDSNCQYYSCESKDIYYGKFYFVDDTLFVRNYVTNTDSSLGEDEQEHHSQEDLYKIIFESGKLKHVERLTFSISTQTWVIDDFVFDEDFLFERVAK